MIEKNVDYIVKSKLINAGYGNQELFIIEQDVTNNKHISRLLANSTKNITKGMDANKPGKPDFIIQSKIQKDTLIIIENKGDTSKHRVPVKNVSAIKTGAVNGVMHYAESLKKEYNVFAIAYSEDEKNLEISTFYFPKGNTSYTELDVVDIVSFDSLLIAKGKKIKVFDIKDNRENHLKIETNKINNNMRDWLELEEEKRATLAACILLSLEDPYFKLSYTNYFNTKDLAHALHITIENKINSKKLPPKEKEAIFSHIAFIKTINDNDRGDKEFGGNSLKELINIFRDEIFMYFQESSYDVIGYFFMSFLKYATKGGGDLGVVLTPDHVAELFVRLTKVNRESIVLDPTMGTGSFLVKAWQKIQEDVKSLDKNLGLNLTNILSNSLGGIELKPSMFTLAYLNMLLNRDGDNQFVLGSSLDKSTIKLFANKYNVGLINPPYSHGSAPELEFVEQLLDTLLPNSLCAAIIPVNSVSKQSKKHGNLQKIKERILRKHSLLASIQMPAQLFYPKGTETVVLLFETRKENSGATWFSIWDDGYEIIKQRGRVQVRNTVELTDNIVEAYEKRAESDIAFNKIITAEDQWVYNVLKEEVISVDKTTLIQTIKDFETFIFLNDMENKDE